MPYDAFISHSSKDKPTADAVCATLEARGIRCWIAPRDIVPGADWSESIMRGISQVKVLVLVFSQHANESAQVKREVQRAFERGVTVVPMRIEEILPSMALEYYISSVHWLDALTPPLERHLAQLADTVEAIVKPGARPPLPVPDPIPPKPIPKPDPLREETRKRPPAWLALVAVAAVFIGLFSAFRPGTSPEKTDRPPAGPVPAGAVAAPTQPPSPPESTALAYAHLIGNEPEKAEQAAKTLVDRSPADAQAHAILGNALIEQFLIKRNPAALESARSEVSLAMRLDPKNALALTGMAGLDSIDGKYKPARKALEEAVSGEPDNAYAHNQLGLEYLRARMYTQAEAEFKKAIELNRAMSWTLANLAEAYRAQGKYALSLETAKQAVGASSGSVAGYVEQSLCLRSLGKPKEAEQALLTGLNAVADSGPIYFYLAHLYDSIGDKAAAKSSLQKARKAGYRAGSLDLYLKYGV